MCEKRQATEHSRHVQLHTKIVWFKYKVTKDCRHEIKGFTNEIKPKKENKDTYSFIHAQQHRQETWYSTNVTDRRKMSVPV